MAARARQAELEHGQRVAEAALKRQQQTNIDQLESVLKGLSTEDFRDVDPAYGKKTQRIESMTELRRLRDEVNFELTDVQKKLRAVQMGVILPAEASRTASYLTLPTKSKEKKVKDDQARMAQQI